MADKMMRMAGRGDDGLAKALSTDNSGRLNTNTNAVRNLTPVGVSLSTAQTEWESTYFSADEYLSATIMVQMSHPRLVEIYIRKIRKSGLDYLAESEYRKLYRAQIRENLYTVDAQIDPGYFQIKVRLVDNVGGNIEVGSKLVMSSRRLEHPGVIQLTTGQLTLANAGLETIQVFNAPVKQFAISFSADGMTDLTASDGISINYIEFFDREGLSNSVRLTKGLLSSAQPQLSFDSPLSSGITSMIPNMSPFGFNIRIQNLTGKNATFKYMITGFN